MPGAPGALQPSAFAKDLDGELYLLDYGRGQVCAAAQGGSVHPSQGREAMASERAARPRAPPFIDPPGYAWQRPEATLLHALVERLARYVGRPPVAVERLALVPPPRKHLTRYHGVFAHTASCAQRPGSRRPIPVHDPALHSAFEERPFIPTIRLIASQDGWAHAE